MVLDPGPVVVPTLHEEVEEVRLGDVGRFVRKSGLVVEVEGEDAERDESDRQAERPSPPESRRGGLGMIGRGGHGWGYSFQRKPAGADGSGSDESF